MALVGGGETWGIFIGYWCLALEKEREECWDLQLSLCLFLSFWLSKFPCFGLNAITISSKITNLTNQRLKFPKL